MWLAIQQFLLHNRVDLSCTVGPSDSNMSLVYTTLPSYRSCNGSYSSHYLPTLMEVYIQFYWYEDESDFLFSFLFCFKLGGCGNGISQSSFPFIC
jgi:hypothetical protein